MKCYRLLRSKHHTEDRDFLRTEFSRSMPGRWNRRDQAVLYTASDVETALAECGVYWILRETERINRQAKEHRRPPTGWQDQIKALKEIEGKLAELEIRPGLNICDLKKSSDADRALDSANLSHIHHPTYLRHDYLDIQGVPTRAFGAWLENEGFDGIQIGSARKSDGHCNIVFGERVTRGEVKVVKTWDVKLFGLKASGSRIDDDFSAYDEDSFEYEFEGQTFKVTPDKIR